MPPALRVVLATLVALLLLALLFRRQLTRWTNRVAARARLKQRGRLDRFKLRGRPHVRRLLLDDAVIAAAVEDHVALTGMSTAQAWRMVDDYVREIVPFFNIIAYYEVGFRLSRLLLGVFYKVSVDHEDRAALRRLQKDAVVVYLMNHRSNADYVLVGYALAGQVAISYAVGEWARAFPLEQIFKSFGGYFVRRQHRERLYHTVLERYVQLITREGVTQGIFLEGGLTRDGRLRPPKVGLLDYVLGIGHDPAYQSRMYVIPVGVNYDRVLEDRSLLRELDRGDRHTRHGRLAQLSEVLPYLLWNLGRLVTRRWKRYGRAAVIIGAPVPLSSWYASQPDLFTIPRAERLARVAELTTRIMERIGALIPVTPVPLVCAAMQSLGGELLPRRKLLDRIEGLRDELVELNARVVRADRDPADTLALALRMLEMRHVVLTQGDGYLILPHGRELVSYYANSIAHLLGPYETAVRARDSLPMETLVI
ncbi:MAG TPA: 1-acyl-sn-glycerol-3-phosphate acyltransferase [Gemmatimonadaceae bacterium]|nr:1-acyl-sn-glycerol-3-phosphate acyltransferase [Gemmatimonadaceae bacterium]